MDDLLRARAERALFERCPGLRCAIEGDGVVSSASASLERALGVPRRGLVGSRLFDHVHEEDREAAAEAIAITRETRGSQCFRSRLVASDGRARSFGWTSLAAGRDDVTFLTAEELPDDHRALQRFRALVDAAPNLIGVCAIPGGVLYLNPAGRRLAGLHDGDLSDLRLADLWPSAARSRLTSEVAPALLDKGVWSGDAPIRRADGVEVPLSRVSMLLRDSAGRAEATGTIAFDIAAEAREGVTLRRFNALAETTSDLVATGTIEGASTYINPAGMKMLGREGQDFRALRLNHVVPRDVLPRFLNEVFPTAITTGLWAGDTRLLRQDGSTFPVSLVVIAIRDESGELAGLGTIGRDTSERAALRQALEQAARGVEAPILQVGKGILAMPVVGRVSESRAAHMKEALLHRVVRAKARVAILDLTGVDEADAQTAGHILAIAKGAALLGSRCFLSGVTSSVARTIADLHVDLSDVPVFATLEQALRAALTSRR